VMSVLSVASLRLNPHKPAEDPFSVVLVFP